MAHWRILFVLLSCIEHIALAVKVVPMDIRRAERRAAERKRDTPAIPLTNGGLLGFTLYEINITVGTPPQPVTLQIDTGSSDIWVYGTQEYEGCSVCLGGSFDPRKSSTSKKLEEGDFWTTYADGSGASGDFISDTVGLGSTTINNVTLAVSTELHSWDLHSPSVMGIGFDVNEAMIEFGSTLYHGLLSHMVNQGIINTRSYSLWLNGLNAGFGSMLFGGYDTDKFTGDLAVLEILSSPYQKDLKEHFRVAWTSLTITDSTGSAKLSPDSFTVPAVLDSGTSATYVPADMYEVLVARFKGQRVGMSSTVIVPCDLGEGSLDFGFGGSSTSVVSVPFSELAIPAIDAETGQRFTDDGNPACTLGLQSAGFGDFTLGDTFLRSAYVVYELDSKLIAMAQSKINSTDSNIVEIPAGGHPFAGARSSAGLPAQVTTPVHQTVTKPTTAAPTSLSWSTIWD